MKEQASNQSNHEKGSVIIAAIYAFFFLAIYLIYSRAKVGLFWVGRKAFAKWKARKPRSAVAARTKALPTPDIFKGAPNLAPAKDFNLGAMRKLR